MIRRVRLRAVDLPKLSQLSQDSNPGLDNSELARSKEGMAAPSTWVKRKQIPPGQPPEARVTGTQPIDEAGASDPG